jgi:hypothetical protein
MSDCNINIDTMRVPCDDLVTTNRNLPLSPKRGIQSIHMNAACASKTAGRNGGPTGATSRWGIKFVSPEVKKGQGPQSRICKDGTVDPRRLYGIDGRKLYFF